MTLSLVGAVGCAVALLLAGYIMAHILPLRRLKKEVGTPVTTTP